MKKWEKFEVDCVNHLHDVLGGAVTIEHFGMSDSTKPDIKISGKKGYSFYIEVKHCPAQSGQFVLFPNKTTNTFDYSKDNAFPLNDSAKQIIVHMNSHFESFRDSSTKGKDIVFASCESVFADWIIQMYRNKGIKYIITNDFKLVKLDDFGKAFNITGHFRIKRSGSDDVGVTKASAVMKEIAKLGYGKSFKTEGRKLFLVSNKAKNKDIFTLNAFEYMIAHRRDNIYEIRKLSNTYHYNVIFSIKKNPKFNSYISENVLIKDVQ